jgi:hypothetical protein
MLGQLLDQVVEIGEHESVPIRTPPIREHTIREHDHVTRLLVTIG